MMFWICLGILAGLALLVGLIEPFCLRTSYGSLPLTDEQLRLLTRRRSFALQRYKADVQGRAGERLRLVFFSDLHVNHLRLPWRYLARRLLESQPDLLVFGGDLVSRGCQARKGLALLTLIAEEARKEGVPLCMVRGNHDAELTDEALRQTGVLLLNNASLLFARGETKKPCVRLTGLEDRRCGRPDLTLALTQGVESSAAELNARFPTARLRFLEPDVRAETGRSCGPSHLLFAHNPDTLLALPPASVDYFFAGHFHGGQIRLPFRLEFKSLRGEKLSKEGYYDGHFFLNGITAFISRGVGCVLFPLRFLVLPEITVFDLND